MTARTGTIVAILFLCSFFLHPASAQEREPLPTIGAFTEGMERVEGFFTFYWDATRGEIWLEIDRWNEEFIYYTSLPRGVGSNDIGLDRGKLGTNRLVYFERRGGKAMMVEPNYDFRAESENPRERLAVEQSFAKSVVWAMTIVAEEGDIALANASYFLTHDANGIARALSRTGQGSYSIDRDRCAIFRENTKAFPTNTEFEVITTFTGQPEGREVRSVTPSSESITVHQRHSFVKLPEPGYQPRSYHPESGYNFTAYVDMATPFYEDRVQRLINRHRLVKKDPAAERSEPVEPIVYYVDSGVPEPIRSALLEGAGWWSEAFEAAGFINGFVVKELPEGADPLDARYNVINWVHRSTRGWSYGASITDPRTGEIIKGHVSLGSLRIRQDYLIATALTAPYGDEEKLKAAREMALARIRQLSAHEVGHTIGLKHNYSASTDNDSSVMDYPHPHVRLAEDGSIDITDAYDTGIGEWDIQAVKYGYSQFQENEAERLAEVLQETREMDLLFLSDPEARPAGSVHPEAHLWDNASNAVERLREIMQIRATALKNFDEKVVAPGTPMSRLEQALVPLFYFHRYQTEAAVKLIGGFRYNYAVRGENELQLIPVSPLEQRQAMEAVLETLDPAALTLSERLLRLIPPPAAGYGRDRESMPGNAFVLDRVAIGRSAAAMTLGLLLNPQRLNRLAEADAMHENYYGLGEMLDDLFEYTWETELPERVDGAVARAIRLEVIDSLIRAAQNAGTHDNARAVITNRLRELALEIDLDDHIYSDEESYQVLARKRIDLFLEEPGEYNPGPQPPVPPGSPIG